MLRKKRSKEKVILDTNFLIDNFKYKVRALSQLRGKSVKTIEPVTNELKRIASKRGRHSACAKLALMHLGKKGLKVLKTKEKSADMALLSMAKKGYIIATHDKLLKQKIKKLGGKVIFIRQKKYLVME